MRNLGHECCASSDIRKRNPYLSQFYIIYSPDRVVDILNASGALDPGSNPGRDVVWRHASG